MVKPKTVFIIVAFLTVGLIGFIILWPSETDRVKKQFKILAHRFEKEPNETNLVSAAKANKSKELFAPIFTIHAPAYDFFREIAAVDLSTLILTARAQYSKMSVDFYDMTITFENPETAAVILTAKLTGQITTGEWVEDIHELACTLEKIEGTWLFRKIEIVEILEK